MNSVLLAALLLGPQRLPALHPDGIRMADPQGRHVTLKGANLGNWLTLEMWMLGIAGQPGAPGDQHELEAILTERFGESEKDRLMEVYRSSWMTDRDFKILRSFGFNVVRLPMNYRLMEDDRKPFTLKPNAWKWIDRAVNESEKHGMYTILDMHGAQGGQSGYDHTGHSGQNRLKDSPEDQRRLAWLWGEIAKRYRNRSAVVAYDVFNEPYGMPKETQVSVFKKAYTEIRRHDPKKLVLAHGHFDNFDHYGDPKAQGWTNVGFQMHYYPGLFGNGEPTLLTQARHLASLGSVQAKVKALNVPFLVGEMNVVFDGAGGAGMMRRTFDLHAKYGWMTTMWSYKVLTLEGGIGDAHWGAATNAGPKAPTNFRKASKAEIEKYFRRFATDKLMVNERLRKALTDPHFVPDPLPELPPVRTTAPQESLPGWTQEDLGGALRGGLRSLPGGAFELYGGGWDIWGRQDQGRFAFQRIEGDFVLEAVVDAVEDIHSYTKAGLMVRASSAPDAPMVGITSFPSAGLQAIYRDKAGTDIQAVGEATASIPSLHLRIERAKGTFRTSYRQGDGPWKQVAGVADTLPKEVLAGALALSHAEDRLVRIQYRDLALRPQPQ